MTWDVSADFTHSNSSLNTKQMEKVNFICSSCFWSLSLLSFWKSPVSLLCPQVSRDVEVRLLTQGVHAWVLLAPLQSQDPAWVRLGSFNNYCYACPWR